MKNSKNFTPIQYILIILFIIITRGTSNTNNDLLDVDVSSNDKFGKRSIEAEQQQTQASFNLSTLNGTNGFLLNGISMGDYFGASASVNDVNNDGFPELVVGAWGVSNGKGAVYVFFGQREYHENSYNLSDLTTNTNAPIKVVVINGISDSDNLGYSVSTAGDINGDGRMDIVLGAPRISNGTGTVYVIFGQYIQPDLDLSTLDGTNGFVVNGLSEYDYVGESVRVGNINGDRYSDLVLGALGVPNGGAMYVIFGQNSFPSAINLSALNGTNGFVLNGIASGDSIITNEISVGDSVSMAGDINKDGFSDLVVVVWGVSNGPGSAYVIFGQSSFPPAFNLSSLNGTNGFVVNELFTRIDHLGWSVSTGNSIQTGDINGDSFSDLVLGAWGLSNGSVAAYVIFGQKSFPSAINLSSLNGTNGFVLNGIANVDSFRTSVSTAGDINYDSKADLVLGFWEVPNGSGSAYVIFGKSSFPPALNLSTLSRDDGFVVNGYSGDYFGATVTAGDINWDYYSDIVVGASGASNYTGSVYVIFGKKRGFDGMPVGSGYPPYIIILAVLGGVLCGFLGAVMMRLLYRRYSIPKQPLIVVGNDYTRSSDKYEPETQPKIELVPVVGDKDSSSEKYSPMTKLDVSSLPIVPVIDPDPEKKQSAKKFWAIDSLSIDKPIASDKTYALVEATDQDKRKVVEFYQHCPVSGYEIASVRVIHNPDMNLAFALYMKKLQQRKNNSAFNPKWPTGRENSKELTESEEKTEWRHRVMEQLKAISKPYQDNDYPEVNILPMWHGTRKEIVDSIFSTGYANLATTDAGFFGKGIYSAYEAEYSFRVYASEGGALIVNWVVCFSAYPVIDGDMEKLKGRGNYANYDAHFIPVVPSDPDNPYEEIYNPTKPNDKGQYTEMVVFASEACLPRYLVELQRTLEQPLPLNRTNERDVFYPSILDHPENENHSSDKNGERVAIPLFPVAPEENKVTQQQQNHSSEKNSERVAIPLFPVAPEEEKKEPQQPQENIAAENIYSRLAKLL